MSSQEQVSKESVEKALALLDRIVAQVSMPRSAHSDAIDALRLLSKACLQPGDK